MWWYIMFMFIGIIVGMMLTAVLSINRWNKTEKLSSNSIKTLKKAEDIITEQVNIIENLERNLEFVTNNLTPNKKKYIGLK